MLVLSISLLALIIILYRFSTTLPAKEADPDEKTAATVVKEISVKFGHFVSDKWEDYLEYREQKKAEREARKAEKEAKKAREKAAKEAEAEAKYLASAESLEYIDSHLEGDTNVVEVKTEEADEVVPETTLVTTEKGERYLSMVDRGEAPNVAVYRYVRIPGELSGIEFRPVQDIVYAAKAAKFYEDPLFEGPAVGTADQWGAYTRLGISKDCCYQLLTAANKVVYADGTFFRRNPENMALTENIEMEEERVELNVKHISQYPSLPNGCEVTSLATVLRFYGFDISKEKLSDDYLPKAPIGEANFYEEFVGNPRNQNAYGCYSGAIVKAANDYLSLTDSKLRAYDYTGSTFQQLLFKIREGKPVIVWATAYLSQAPGYTTEWIVDGEYLVWKGNLHCMVLCGYDTLTDKVIVSDPMRGIEEYDMELFIKRFKQFYSQAVVIE